MPGLTSDNFRANSVKALGNAQLQRALDNIRRDFVDFKGRAVGELPEYDALKREAIALKDHTIENLDFYLDAFAKNVEASGGHIHWCQTAGEARETIVAICKKRGAQTMAKGKSMVGEEIGLNAYLEAAGLTPIETDLGEYIIQMRGETPSHITAPAIHLTKEDVADTFAEHHNHARRPAEIPALIAEARQILRPRYHEADIGLTGANFLIAETGSSVIITNEGNGDLSQILPRTHIVLASIDKIVPTIEDALTVARILARTSSGQEFTVYTTFSTGARRPGDLDGPEEFHVVLLDNGRSALVGTKQQAMLRCIRCAACLNHCPVYKSVGGHAYGSVYTGPMGAVLTPIMIGIEKSAPLPNASTFCGRCEAVCPMGIPLPALMRDWRERDYERADSPAAFRTGIGVWAYLVKRPRLYALATRLATAALKLSSGRRGRLARLPMAKGWTTTRDFPAPEGVTFRAQWRRAKEQA
ncbi:MAG: lactate utilization protein [Alphaproteobacteria bacterium]|nr:lactate utilization protein [Alphaproteobacteria bacterium]